MVRLSIRLNFCFSWFKFDLIFFGFSKRYDDRKKSYHEKNIEVANGLLTNARSHIEELNQQQHLILSSVLLMLQTLISPSNQLYKTII